MKSCSHCHTSSPATLEYFPHDKKHHDGLSSWCRACFARKAAQWYATNAEKAKTTRATYYRKHIVKIKTQSSAWQKANPEKVNASKRRRYQENPEPFRIREAAHRAMHQEKERQRHAQYAKDNPDKRVVNEQRRRANKINAPVNDFTHAQWVEIQAAFDHRCAYCGRRAKGHLTQDHITPLSKGGSHTASNIVPACRSCNTKKHTGPPLSPVQPLLLTLAPSKP